METGEIVCKKNENSSVATLMSKHNSLFRVCPIITPTNSSTPDTKHQRARFVEEHFACKCSLGNPNISLDNVFLISRSLFLQNNSFITFEEIANGHFPPRNLNRDCVVLFVSHRWPEPGPNCPNNMDASQYKVVVQFLLSEFGQKVTHLWIDYACMNQKPENKDDHTVSNKQKQLDNIQTAIFISDLVLVVPRISTYSNHQACFTDLKDYASRGWCIFEYINSLLAGCKLFVTFTCGTVNDSKFVLVSQGKDQLTLQDLCSSPKFPHLKSVVEKHLSQEGENYSTAICPEASANWNHAIALDPCHTANTVLKLVNKYQCYRGMISLTLDIGDEFGQKIAERLQNFTIESDREVVTNLLANVAGFCLNKYESIKQRNVDELDDILKKAKLSDTEMTFYFDGRFHTPLFSVDIDNLLQRVCGLQKKKIPIRITLRIPHNSLGFSIGNIISKHSVWACFTKLDLQKCMIGDAGTNLIAKFLVKETACFLVHLDISQNCISSVGAGYLGKALLSNLWLKHLVVSKNRLCNEGVELLSKSFTANKALTTIDLSANCITNHGLKCLSQSLSARNSCSSLATINLSHNFIKDLTPLSELVQNETIKFIDLTNNSLTFETRSRVLKQGKGKITLEFITTQLCLWCFYGLGTLMLLCGWSSVWQTNKFVTVGANSIACAAFFYYFLFLVPRLRDYLGRERYADGKTREQSEVTSTFQRYLTINRIYASMMILYGVITQILCASNVVGAEWMYMYVGFLWNGGNAFYGASCAFENRFLEYAIFIAICVCISVCYICTWFFPAFSYNNPFYLVIAVYNVLYWAFVLFSRYPCIARNLRWLKLMLVSYIFSLNAQ